MQVFIPFLLSSQKIRQLTFIGFITGFLLARLNATHTFTSIDGRAVEADVVALSDSIVTIRRSSDGRMFELDLNRLIPADVAFIEEWFDQDQVQRELPSANEVIGKWPRKVKPENYDIEIVCEENATKAYIYRTPHFEFHSDVKLARKAVRDFSQIFESTLLVVAELPLKFNPSLPQGTLFLTQIFETEESYQAAGGIPNSAGVYFRKDRRIMVPLKSLGVKKSSSAYTINERKKSGTLTHEITHQVTHEWLDKLPIWVSEGIAEYIEHVPYDRGAFRFDRYEVGEALRRSHLKLTPLKVLMNMDQSTWNQTLAKNKKAASSNYLSVFVLYYYFCHFDLDEAGKPKRLYDYLRAVEAGEHLEGAIKILLDGRSYEALEESVRQAFRRSDIDIEFL